VCNFEDRHPRVEVCGDLLGCRLRCHRVVEYPTTWHVVNLNHASHLRLTT
jgi:hypothetical protein